MLFTSCSCQTQTVIEHRLLVWCPAWFCAGLTAVHITDLKRYQFFRCQSDAVCWWHTAVHRTQWHHLSLYTVGLFQCCATVQHWLDFSHSGLPMNPDKTDTIVISTSARQRAEGLSDTLDLPVSVKLVTSVQSLGVRINNTLSFREHTHQNTLAVDQTPNTIQDCRYSV